MPFVQIHTIRGMLNPMQKQQLLKKIADVMVEIEGASDPDFKKSVWITINESEAESWFMGGVHPDIQQIQQFLAARDSRLLQDAHHEGDK